MILRMILRSIFWYFCAVLSLILRIPHLLTAKRKSSTEYNKYVHSVASRWALGNAKRSGSRFHIEGLENIPRDEAVLFVSNHQGDFDIAAFLAYLPVPHGYVAKIEIMKIPLLRTWMKNMHCVFIDRKNMRQTARALLEGVKILQNGQSLVLFPEGTRSKSENLGEFKAASFKLAIKANVPIVPASINGTYRILEANKGLIRPADVYVKFHPPIRPDEFGDSRELSDQVREIIFSSLCKK